jgi:hypothetical protein
MFGGLLESGLVVLFGLCLVLGALVAISLKAAAADAAFNLIATGIVVMAVLAYFAHQRDRFQRRSDDLLHNILPDEIADRLKVGR